MLLKQTKIVATISDKRCDVDFIKNLFKSGMNVVRINTAHAAGSGIEQIINNVRTVSNRIALLMDTKGPEIRTTANKENEVFEFEIGETVKIYADPQRLSTKDAISVSYLHLVQDLKVGEEILIDDGDLDLIVIEKKEDYLVCKVKNNAKLGSRKSVNIPGVRINLPSITEKDKNNILFAIEKDIDFIAHSFVRNKDDVLAIREILDEHDSDIQIIAKIENQEGVDNIHEILEVADGVMIARGDLGIEIPQERIPGIQRKLIRECMFAKKPVIVATQMLHSMIQNPRPTRAEVTDIANAIYYRTDALMLSGETAYGNYPIEAVKTMTSVAAQAEEDQLEDKDIDLPLDPNNPDVTAFLSKQAVKATALLDLKAIITDSYSGRTARNLAAFRGYYPVLAICYKEKTMRHLALSYGIEPIYMPELANGQEYYFAALRRLINDGVLQLTDRVGYLSSGKAGTQTSFLEINVVGDVLKHADEVVLPNKNRYL
ncbi:MAG: pyruvate kinase [Bacteroidales bacterium]|nr:pyruvate kinase [Bacteroidales bacterium]